MNKETLSAYKAELDVMDTEHKAELSLIEARLFELKNIPNLILEETGYFYHIYNGDRLTQTRDKDLYEKFKTLGAKFSTLREARKDEINKLESRKLEINALLTYEYLNVLHETLMVGNN